jgi:ABC-type uncharacterized transport system permease subunit
MNILTYGFFAAVLLATAPVLLAAIGGMLCSRAGVFNIALEGQMLIGCFWAVVVSDWTGNIWLALAAAAAAGVITSLILAIGSITLGADSIVLSIGINLLAVGVTGFLLRELLGTSGTFSTPDLVGFKDFRTTWVGDIPVIGQLLASSTWLVVLALVLVPMTSLYLGRTKSGLRLRGVGENIEAARALGVNVNAYQHGVVLVCGLLCGIAGAQLALGNVRLFSEQMTSGRGWVAVVAIMLGRSMPWPVLLACLGFGAAEALGFRLQGVGLPQQATDAAPYLVTLLALVLSSVRLRRNRAVLPPTVEAATAAHGST